MFRFIYDYIITSQDKLVSPYHGSVGRACCEPGTLRFRVDVTTHYDTVILLCFFASLYMRTYVLLDENMVDSLDCS